MDSFQNDRTIRLICPCGKAGRGSSRLQSTRGALVSAVSKPEPNKKPGVNKETREEPFAPRRPRAASSGAGPLAGRPFPEIEPFRLRTSGANEPS